MNDYLQNMLYIIVRDNGQFRVCSLVTQTSLGTDKERRQKQQTQKENCKDEQYGPHQEPDDGAREG